MNITMLHDGALVALLRSRWTDNIYVSRSVDNGEGWSTPQATELSSNNSSTQVATFASDELALVYSAMGAAGAIGRRAPLYGGIISDGDSRKESTATGRSAFWGTPRMPTTIAISVDGGKSQPRRRNLDGGDGCCIINSSLEELGHEFSYLSIKQGPDSTLRIAYTWRRQIIKYVRISPEWVKGQVS